MCCSVRRRSGFITAAQRSGFSCLNRKQIDGLSRMCVCVWQLSYQFPSSVCIFQNFHESHPIPIFKSFLSSSASSFPCVHVFLWISWREWSKVGKRCTDGVLGLHFLTATWLEQPITLIGRVDILWHSGHSRTNQCAHLWSVSWQCEHGGLYHTKTRTACRVPSSNNMK